MKAVNIGSMLARFSEHWAPKKIAELNDYDVKIVKLQGTSPGTAMPTPTNCFSSSMGR